MSYLSSTAIIEGEYRYLLTRCFRDDNDKCLAFIMLNPSTADEKVNDRTISKCISFSKSFGYDGIVVVNLYALRSTDPKNLLTHKDPVGPSNEEYLKYIADNYDMAICAWGNNAKEDRVKQFINIFKNSKCQLMCLGINKNGSPKHPLYVRSNSKLIKWEKPQ